VKTFGRLRERRHLEEPAGASRRAARDPQHFSENRVGGVDRRGVDVAARPLDDDLVALDGESECLTDHWRGEPLKHKPHRGSENRVHDGRVRRSDLENVIEVPVARRGLGPIGLAAASATQRRDDPTIQRVELVRDEPGHERVSGVGLESESDSVAGTLNAERSLGCLPVASPFPPEHGVYALESPLADDPGADHAGRVRADVLEAASTYTLGPQEGRTQPVTAHLATARQIDARELTDGAFRFRMLAQLRSWTVPKSGLLRVSTQMSEYILELSGDRFDIFA
jgi:hypothetical protein